MFGHGDDNHNDQNQHFNASDNGTMTPPVADDSTISTPMPAHHNDDHDDAGHADKDIMSPAPTDDLITIKQEALQQLTPLVGHLDQTPEEKFRTLMMMIQAADDHTKLKDAFEAAKQISDDKIRAQALLDVINEINYFTQQSGQE